MLDETARALHEIAYKTKIDILPIKGNEDRIKGVEKGSQCFIQCVESPVLKNCVSGYIYVYMKDNNLCVYDTTIGRYLNDVDLSKYPDTVYEIQRSQDGYVYITDCIYIAKKHIDSKDLVTRLAVVESSLSHFERTKSNVRTIHCHPKWDHSFFKTNGHVFCTLAIGTVGFFSDSGTPCFYRIVTDPYVRFINPSE